MESDSELVPGHKANLRTHIQTATADTAEVVIGRRVSPPERTPDKKPPAKKPAYTPIGYQGRAKMHVAGAMDNLRIQQAAAARDKWLASMQKGK